MADKRMFSKKILCSTTFVEMPLQSQMLYVQLSMAADDDGIVDNAKIVQRMANIQPKFMKVLIDNGYVLELEKNLHIIKHWRVNNNIDKSKYRSTIYEDALKTVVLVGREYKKIGDKGVPEECPKSAQEETIEQNRKEQIKTGENSPECADSGMLSIEYELFRRKLNEVSEIPYPSSRLDFDEAKSHWEQIVSEIDNCSEGNVRLVTAIQAYISNLKDDEMKYVPKLSNLLSTHFYLLESPLAEYDSKKRIEKWHLD